MKIVLNEPKLASLLIGCIQVLWSFLSFSGDYDTLSLAIVSHRIEHEWFFMMFGTGILLIAGSVCRWRSGRHIGLFLSMLVLLSTFGVFVKFSAWTPVTATMPLLALMCLILLVHDSRGKPREIL